jgi:hypothetical protein
LEMLTAISPRKTRCACGAGSPSQEPTSEYRTDHGAEHDGSAIPECDKRDGAARMVKRDHRGAQCPGYQSRDRTGPHEVGRRSLAQGPNERREWREREERMQIRQAAHCGPNSMPLQAAGWERTSATAAPKRMAKNMSPIRNSGRRPGSPGRADLSRKLVPAASKPSVMTGAFLTSRRSEAKPHWN